MSEGCSLIEYKASCLASLESQRFDKVIFHYIGYNESGRRIDSTYIQGAPSKVRLGTNGLVPGSYSKSVPQVQQFYNSSKYEDELLWAASWLYHATEDPMYLNYVTVRNGKAFGIWGNPSWFSWDNKLATTQVLSRISFFGPEEIPDEEKLGLQMYSKTIEYVMCSILPGSPTKTTKMTDGGMIWVDDWNSLQYSIATTFLVVIYSDYMLTSKTPTMYCSGKLYNATDLRNFSISQAEYFLGNNPLSMSYLIGYGDNNPQYIHHRGSSIQAAQMASCGLTQQIRIQM